MKMKHRFIFIGMLALLATACSDKKSSNSENKAEEPVTGLAIDENSFPDPAFRAALMGTDAGEVGILTHEELTDFSLLDVSDKGITDLTGVEHFPYLNFINVNYNPLRKLDLSKNGTLTELYCVGCQQLTTLTLGAQPKMEKLNFGASGVRELDVTQCPSLEMLFCPDTPIANIDLSGCPKLQEICCDVTLIPALDLTACPGATFVDGSGEPI